jgi:hypothetical protein
MTSFRIPIPAKMMSRTLESLSSSDSITDQITSVIVVLQSHFDKRIERYRRERLIQQLGFHVSKGLPSANRQALERARQRGILLDGVNRSDQFRVIASSKSTRSILERVILAAVTGTSTPSASQLDELIRIGESLSILESCRAVADLAERARPGSSDRPNLGSVSVQAYGLGVVVEYHPGDFDLERWVQLVERPIGRSEIELDILANAFGAKKSVAGDLQDVSNAARTDLGFSVEDVLKTLAVLLQLCLDREYEFLGFDEVPVGPDVSQAAVEYLTFSSGDMSLSDLRPSATRHQGKRIWTSPLLKVGTRYYIFRDLVFEAISRWTRYLTQGDWPVPRNVLSKTAPNLYHALGVRSRESGKVFERYVDARLDEIGLPRATLNNGARIGTVKLSREVDSIVVDTARRRIHVLEFKNMSSDQNAKSLQNELGKFLGEYSEKLRRTMREVELDKLAFVRRVLGAREAKSVELGEATSWSVEAAFVFSSHSPIECLTSPQFFTGVSADRVTELFVSQSDEVGHAPA